jgi:hypothetical protein
VLQSVHDLSHQSNGEAGGAPFCVAERAEGLPHLGTCLAVLPALQSLTPLSHSIGATSHRRQDLVGPLPISAGYTYCLTAVDPFTSWPEAISIPDMTADTVARALLTGFRCPTRDVSLNLNFSTPWPSSEAFNSHGQLHITQYFNYYTHLMSVTVCIHWCIRGSVVCYKPEGRGFDSASN